MKKLAVLFIITFVAIGITSNAQNNTPESIKTITQSASVGETISIEINDVYSKGYKFNPPLYDSLMFRFEGELYLPPTENTDEPILFMFKVLKAGNTEIIITATSRVDKKIITLCKDIVSVNDN